jgi:hypothetical protein
MSDNSKKLSELPQATSLAKTDRVVILRDPSGSPSARTITAENLSNSLTTNLSINNVAVNSATSSNTNYKTTATTLSLTKQVQSLGTNSEDQAHNYYLPNGSNGQLMYITTKTGNYAEENILIWMDNMRIPSGEVIANSYWIWNGAGWARSLALTMFVDGAWNIDGGGWGP